jgi:hypothetical protein
MGMRRLLLVPSRSQTCLNREVLEHHTTQHPTDIRRTYTQRLYISCHGLIAKPGVSGEHRRRRATESGLACRRSSRSTGQALISIGHSIGGCSSAYIQPRPTSLLFAASMRHLRFGGFHGLCERLVSSAGELSTETGFFPFILV